MPLFTLRSGKVVDTRPPPSQPLFVHEFKVGDVLETTNTNAMPCFFRVVEMKGEKTVVCRQLEPEKKLLSTLGGFGEEAEYTPSDEEFRWTYGGRPRTVTCRVDRPTSMWYTDKSLMQYGIQLEKWTGKTRTFTRVWRMWM